MQLITKEIERKLKANQAMMDEADERGDDSFLLLNVKQSLSYSTQLVQVLGFYSVWITMVEHLVGLKYLMVSTDM